MLQDMDDSFVYHDRHAYELFTISRVIASCGSQGDNSNEIFLGMIIFSSFLMRTAAYGLSLLQEGIPVISIQELTGNSTVQPFFSNPF